MPELPDITVYLEALERRIVGERLLKVRIASPFLLRTFDPPLAVIEGKIVRALERLGKRIVIGFDDELWLVLHLMIAGRLHWKATGAKLAAKYNLAAFEFSSGTLALTEASAKRRVALYLVQGSAALAAHDPGGLDVMSASLDQFASVLRAQSHAQACTY